MRNKDFNNYFINLNISYGQDFVIIKACRILPARKHTGSKIRTIKRHKEI